MKQFSITNYIMLFVCLIVLAFLYNRFEDKLKREETSENYDAIQKYLLDDTTLAKSKKPILWIHVPYEYNSRKWLSFGSRSSLDLNQPYLYLTVKSIIDMCGSSFTICIIDDNAFDKLIPDWSIDLNLISSPIVDNVRKLGMMKLMYKYGGMVCPLSFLCIKDLIGLYKKGTRNDKMFVGEKTNRNITSSSYDFYPDLNFCGAPKNNTTVGSLIDFIQRTISNDSTAESEFLGVFNRWCNARIKSGDIVMINGVEIGTKTVDEQQITVEDLMSNNYLNLYTGTYGILIPADEIVKRRKYEWFARLSSKQVLESNTILGNYFLVNMGEGGNILEPLKTNTESKMVGFWKVPSDAPYYGLKPNMLGDNVSKIQHPDN